MSICGRKPQSVDIMSILPDEVVRVMCHTMAYCTSDEPNSDIVCADKNRVIDLFQLISFIIYIVLLQKNKGCKQTLLTALIFIQAPSCGKQAKQTKRTHIGTLYLLVMFPDELSGKYAFSLSSAQCSSDSFAQSRCAF